MVFYSHMHAHQTHGINDLGLSIFKIKQADVYSDSITAKYLKKL